MKNLVTKESVKAFSWSFLVVAVAMVLPELAMAQNVTATIGNLLQDSAFKKILTFGLYLYAAYKWFDYFVNFKPSSAFMDIIVPAAVTFVALKWDTMLGWFGIK